MIVAIAACTLFPDLSPSNACLRDALEAEGVEVRVLLWNRDPFDAFLACDRVLLRQTWDYLLDPGGFAAWAVRLEALGGRLENPATLAIWNNDKRSLLEIGTAESGIVTPQTTFVLDGNPPTLRDPLPSGRIVLKPVFGGGGHGVRMCTHETLAEGLADLRVEAPGQPVMAQEFLPEIADGEWKMTCIDGEVALSILAVPRAGEFRINNKFQPSVTLAEAPADARRVAQDLMRQVGTPLCGRVDGVMRGDQFICTELELTDPDLHLQLEPQPLTAQLLAKRTIARIEHQR